MSLKKKTFDFLKLVRSQKEGATSLFQPPSGEIRGNIRPVNSSDGVIEIFWAASVKKKSITIPRSKVLYPLAPINFVADNCKKYYSNSTIINYLIVKNVIVFFLNVKMKWIIAFIFLSACVEPIHFNVAPAQFQIVIEGMISDNPGPYTVKISTALNLDADSLFRPPIVNAKIKLFDDEGRVEEFIEANPGEYKTAGIIQGQVGHEYYIRIETSDGKVFESEADKINPVGEIENIRYEFEAIIKKEEYGDIKADVFNIYLDANAGKGEENYVRWRFNGTYKVLTNPELRLKQIMEFTIKDPLPCSGYIVAPASGGGKLEQIADCTCCTCWAHNFESMPQLSDVQFINENKFRNIKVAEVPINQATFYDKYRVEVEQMSLSRKAFDFFKLIRIQKEGASSIFQSPSGEIKGNIKSINSSDPVVGIFWATSIKSKSLYIYRNEVPYTLPPIYYVTDKCTNYYANASTAKPAFWE